MMLMDEYSMVVKGLDFVSTTDGKSLLQPILHQIRENLDGQIVDVWQVEDARGGVILKHLLCDEDGQRDRNLQQFQVSETSRGILSWVAERSEPIWLQGIQDCAEECISNIVSGTEIKGRYFDFAEHTNSLIVVPVSFRGKLRGLISVESSMPQQFNLADIATLRDLAGPTGILLWKIDASQQNSQHTEQAIASFRTTVDRSTTRLNPYRTGFVARPFQPHFQALSDELRRIFRIHEIRATEYFHTPGSRDQVLGDMMKQIAAAHFGVADLTSLSDNVLIELGMLIGLDKPVLLFHEHQGKDDVKLPFDITGFYLYRYVIEKGEISIVEPAQAEHRSAEDVVSAFVNEKLRPQQSFQNALAWTE